MSSDQFLGEVDSSSIDEYDHVNYKNYPALFELGQDDYLDERGLSFEKLETELGIRSVVLTYQVTVKSDLVAGDKYAIDTVLKLGNTSLTFVQTMTKGNNVLVATMEMVVVLVEADDMRRKVPISNDLRASLS